jgi:hypothetical protein
MNLPTGKHLREEQFIGAVVDKHDISLEMQAHLKECRSCREQLISLQETIDLLGEKAGMNVPVLTRQVRLPVEEEPVFGNRLTGWIPSLGVAAAIVLAFFIFYRTLPDQSTIQDQLTAQKDYVEDELLMFEIGELVENALPEAYSEISGGITFDFDNEFLQFVVPDAIDDTQSYNHSEGGLKQC